MRTRPLSIFSVLVLVLGFVFVGQDSRLQAQAPEGPDTTDATTNDSTGIVTAVGSDRTITVDSRRGPFTYRLGLDLHITGPDNHALKISEVLPGDKVTVYYFLRDGQQTVARIVVLERRKPARK